MPLPAFFRGGAAALGLALVAWAGNGGAVIADFPAPVRSWETIPGVVRSDGVATFRVEVDVNGPVAGVRLSDAPACLVPSDDPSLVLRDDGLGGDRAAGDFVFTSPPLRWACAIPATMRSDPSSPADVDVADVAAVRVTELDGTTSTFTGRPGIGLLAPGVAATRTVALSRDVVVSPHLVNVRSAARDTQRFLRFPSDALAGLTRVVYAVVPDAFDFLVFFSTLKVERQDAVGRNLVAGTHRSVKVNFAGTGQGPLDNTTVYGSAGRLLGVNALDTYGRGLLANVVTHELLHQWVAYPSPTLGLSDGEHYSARSDVASLVGGFRWSPAAGGGFTLDCTEGRSGAHYAAPLDRYMMGLIAADAVPALHVAASENPICGGAIGSVAITLTVADIQAVHGPRLPGPASAQRDFALGFVAESRDRLLDVDEMTFYDILAEHYTKPIPAGTPDPYQGSAQWASIARFFGDDTSWRSDVPLCGNGTLEHGEECDDGNRVAGDGCSVVCRREIGEVVVGVELGALPALRPRSNALLSVALLSDAGFDATGADVATVRFGRTGSEAAAQDARRGDVDRDGRADLVLRFKTRDTRIACGDALAFLTGRTRTGLRFAGSGALVLMGCS